MENLCVLGASPSPSPGAASTSGQGALGGRGCHQAPFVKDSGSLRDTGYYGEGCPSVPALPTTSPMPGAAIPAPTPPTSQALAPHNPPLTALSCAPPLHRDEERAVVTAYGRHTGLPTAAETPPRAGPVHSLGSALSLRGHRARRQGQGRDRARGCPAPRQGGAAAAPEL